MGVVDVELHALKHRSHSLCLLSPSVHDVFGVTIKNLPCNNDLVFALHSGRRECFVLVVEDDRNTSLHDTCVTPFIYQLLQVCDSHMG